MNKVIYGSENSGLELEYITDANGDFVGINSVTLLCFNKKQPINDIVDSMLTELDMYVRGHIETQKKYRRLEKQFDEVLKDTVIIQNEPIYIECLREFESRTKNCDSMADMNGGRG